MNRQMNPQPGGTSVGRPGGFTSGRRRGGKVTIGRSGVRTIDRSAARMVGSPRHLVGSPRQPEPMGDVGGRFRQACRQQAAVGADQRYLESARRSRP